MGKKANSPQRLSTEQISRIRELRAKGFTYQAIADDVGISQSAAKKHAKGILEPDSRRKHVTQELIDQAREMRKNGQSYASICIALGMDKSTVKKYVADVEYHSPKGALKEDDVQRLRDLRKQGYSIGYISVLTGRSQGTVLKYTRGIVVKREIKPKPSRKELPKTGGLCRHKSSCIYWRPVIGVDCFGCHYPFERGELRPWPADQCPGFPKKKGKHEN